MNHLNNLTKLKNHYWAMRHGQSKANLQNIIISHPENGTHEDYGLTELGQEQAKAATANSPLTKETIMYCSDFSRARETAHIVQQALGVPDIHVSHKLRERHFGNWEKGNSTNLYDIVWVSDGQNADHVENGVEAANAVLDRATALIVELEKKYRGKNILLISHGDTLQILQTGFRKIDASKHRSLPNLETAEIRELVLA
jgi:broad specificity phosphatase PhoE